MLSELLLPSRETSVPWLTVREFPASAFGLSVSLTVTFMVSVCSLPAASFTVSVTVKAPALLNVYVGPEPYRVWPPPSANVHV